MRSPVVRWAWPNALERSVILLGLLLFWVLATFQLTLPGLNYDEALDVVPSMQLLLGQPTDPLRGSGLWLAGRRLPFMVMDYKGSVHTYWSLPFLWGMGINVFSLRFSCCFLGLLTLALLHRFVRRLYGPTTAGMSLCLLAVSPCFLFWNRQGVLWTTAMLTCSVGALAAFAEWVRGRIGGFRTGMFLLGLGVSAKLAFLWFPVALSVSVSLPQVRRLWPVRRRCAVDIHDQRLPEPALRGVAWCGAKQVMVGALALLLGLLPLLCYNLQTGGTGDALLRNLRTSYYGVDNLAYLSNLGLRWQHLQALLQCSEFWYLGGVYRDVLFPLAFWAAVGGMLAWGLHLTIHRVRRVAGSAPPNSRPLAHLLFPLSMMASMVLLSGATVSGLWPEHYMLLLPFPQLAIALGLELLRRCLPARGAAARLPLLALLALMAGQLRVDGLYHRALSRSGGFSSHSDAMYTLADYLNDKARPVVAMDWGIRASVQFLTQGRVNPEERFGFESLDHPGLGLATEMAAYLENRETYYIFHAPEETVYRGRREAFEALVRQRGLIPDGKRIIYDRSARPLFVVMEVDDPA